MYLLFTDVKQHSRKAMSIQNTVGNIPAQVPSATTSQTTNLSSESVAINSLTFPYCYRGAVVTKIVYPSKIIFVYANSHD